MNRNRIAELRKETGINQRELSERLGVAQTTVSAWENGRNEPDIETFQKLADIFKVNIGYVAGYSNKMESTEDENDFEQELYERTGMHLKQLKELQNIAANWLIDFEQKESELVERPPNPKANIFDKTVIATALYAFLLTLSLEDKKLFISGKMELPQFTNSTFFQKLTNEQQYYIYKAYVHGKW